MHGFSNDIVTSALAGSSGFPTDGECLLVSTATEAAIEQGMLYSAGHVGAHGAGALIGAGRTSERACGTLGQSPGHGLGFFCAKFGVGDSCHVVGLERNIFLV